MSLYSDLNEVLTPYAQKIKNIKADLEDLDERVEALEESSGGDGGGSGLTSEVKDALLAIFQHVAYTDSNGQTYYDALEEALYPTVTTRTVSYSLSHVTSSNNASTVTSGASYTATLTASSGYTINTVTVTMGGADVTSTVYSSGTITIPSVTGNIVITATAVASVSSISAVYTQSGTVYTNTNLDSLKSDLVVTATYTGGTTSTIPGTDYTLSGSLTEGTSTITVSYGGKTTTFDVEVTDQNIPVGIRGVDMLVTGLTKEGTNRATTDMIRVTGGQSITVTSSAFHIIRLTQYDINKSFLPNASDIGNSSASTATGTLDASCDYIRILMKKSDNSDITEQEMLASTLTIDGVSWGLARSTEENGIAILKVAKRGVSATGDYTESSIRVSTDMIPVRKSAGKVVIATTSGEYLKAWTYESDGTFINGQGTFDTASITVDFSKNKYHSFRITFKNSDDSEFTDADMLAITGTIHGVPFVVEESSV